jgi:nucleotide-binding universal stress UspA family protein
MTGPVVVALALDDVEGGGRLLVQGAREAAARGSALWLAHVYSGFTAPATPMAGPDPALVDVARRDAIAGLEAAASRVRTEHPGLHIETVPLSGPPAHALADTANGGDASLLVVGGRGRGGLAGRMLGSVSLRVLTLARCPVLVVRGDPAPDKRRVMIGLDVADPVSGPETIAFAFEEAERRGADVYAFHAWDDPATAYLSFDEEVIRRRREADLAEGRSRLARALAPWAARHPGVRYTSEVLAGSAAELLAESTGLADLLVVGGKARNEGDGGMRIGALTRTVLYHARCPVAVVPEH